MRYFHKVAAGVMVMPLMNRLMQNPQLWDEDRLRTTFDGTPHALVSDILLRWGTKGPDEAADDLLAADRPAMSVLRGAKDMSFNVMTLVGGVQLGRVVVTKLEPGDRILPHADVRGKYADYYQRYHVVLQGLPGSLFTCGDETVNMQTGEIYWFDAHSQHSVQNNSADDRVHLMVDVRIDP